MFHSPPTIIPRFEVITSKVDELPNTKSKRSPTQLKKCPDNLKDGRADRTIFVGNIPSTCTRRHIKQLFKQHCSVESIRLRSLRVSPGDMPSKLAKKKHQRLLEGSTFNAYVVLSSTTDAENCLALNGTIFHGRHLRVDILAGKKNMHVNQRSVFIGNLPFSADEEKVREVFSICGDIENVRIVRDPRTGIGKGFGFITFVDTSGVMFALKQNKRAVVDKRYLRVTRSKDQTSLKEERQVKISGSKAGHGKKRRPDGSKNRLFRIPTATS